MPMVIGLLAEDVLKTVILGATSLCHCYLVDQKLKGLETTAVDDLHEARWTIYQDNNKHFKMSECLEAMGKRSWSGFKLLHSAVYTGNRSNKMKEHYFRYIRSYQTLF